MNELLRNKRRKKKKSQDDEQTQLSTLFSYSQRNTIKNNCFFSLDIVCIVVFVKTRLILDKKLKEIFSRIFLFPLRRCQDKHCNHLRSKTVEKLALKSARFLVLRHLELCYVLQLVNGHFNFLVIRGKFIFVNKKICFLIFTETFQSSVLDSFSSNRCPFYCPTNKDTYAIFCQLLFSFSDKPFFHTSST